MTYRDDDIPFAGVRSFAVEVATVNIANQEVLGRRELILIPKGIENGWKKYGLYGTWNSGTYPYGIGIIEASFVGGEYYSTSAFFKTNCQEKFVTYFNSIDYVNFPVISYGTTKRKVFSDGSIYLAREGFAYVDSVLQPGNVTLRPKQDGETFNPNQHFLYVKNIQIEKKPFATSYVDGSRPAPVLCVDIPDIEYDNFVFTCWANFRNIPSVVQVIANIFTDEAGGVNRYRLQKDGADSFHLHLNDSILGSEFIAYRRLNKGWHFFLIAVHDGHTELWIDDTKYTGTKYVQSSQDKKIYIGTAFNKNSPWNNTIANIFIGKYKKPDGTVIWTDDYIQEM